MAGLERHKNVPPEPEKTSRAPMAESGDQPDTPALTITPYVRHSEIVNAELRDARQSLPDSGSAHTVIGIQAAYSF